MKDAPIDPLRTAESENCAEVISDMRCQQRETEP